MGLTVFLSELIVTSAHDDGLYHLAALHVGYRGGHVLETVELGQALERQLHNTEGEISVNATFSIRSLLYIADPSEIGAHLAIAVELDQLRYKFSRNAVAFCASDDTAQSLQESSQLMSFGPDVSVHILPEVSCSCASTSTCLARKQPMMRDLTGMDSSPWPESPTWTCDARCKQVGKVTQSATLRVISTMDHTHLRPAHSKSHESCSCCLDVPCGLDHVVGSLSVCKVLNLCDCIIVSGIDDTVGSKRLCLCTSRNGDPAQPDFRSLQVIPRGWLHVAKVERTSCKRSSTTSTPIKFLTDIAFAAIRAAIPTPPSPEITTDDSGFGRAVNNTAPIEGTGKDSFPSDL